MLSDNDRVEDILRAASRQAVDKWLLAGPPAERAPKIGAIAELADILWYRLLPGLPQRSCAAQPRPMAVAPWSR